MCAARTSEKEASNPCSKLARHRSHSHSNEPLTSAFKKNSDPVMRCTLISMSMPAWPPPMQFREECVCVCVCARACVCAGVFAATCAVQEGEATICKRDLLAEAGQVLVRARKAAFDVSARDSEQAGRVIASNGTHVPPSQGRLSRLLIRSGSGRPRAAHARLAQPAGCLRGLALGRVLEQARPAILLAHTSLQAS